MSSVISRTCPWLSAIAIAIAIAINNYSCFVLLFYSLLFCKHIYLYTYYLNIYIYIYIIVQLVRQYLYFRLSIIYFDYIFS